MSELQIIVRNAGKTQTWKMVAHISEQEQIKSAFKRSYPDAEWIWVGETLKKKEKLK